MKEIIEKINCKYILPCGRCDRHGNACEIVERELLERLRKEECDHELKIIEHESHERLICVKCGKIW